MAIQLDGRDEVMVVKSVESSTELEVLRGAFDTVPRSSAGSDDEINILGSVDDLVCAPNACDIDNITGAAADAGYSSCDGKQSGELCAVECFEGYMAYDAQGQTVDATDFRLVCNANGDFQDTSGIVCQANSCDIDDIANAVANADYSSCDQKTTGEDCTPVCRPGSEPITSASQPINLVCDADGDFTDTVALTGAAVSDAARLSAPLSNFTDLQQAGGRSSTALEIHGSSNTAVFGIYACASMWLCDCHSPPA